MLITKNMILFNISQTETKNYLSDNENNGIYICATCKTKITTKSNLIYISNNYFHKLKNPIGFVYNIFTFNYCESYIQNSPPQIKDTWFPPYKWIIILCKNCQNLLGWKYVNEKNNPPFFYGLISTHLQLI